MIGKTILHYRITGKIGSGGMGVVWKALDTRLDREVALKVLPESATADPSRRERFIREAKAASALNHPNIVTVYEINSDGETHFIAMELVRGVPLSQMLHDHKPLPASRALKYGTQLADGLGQAHRAGIIHRDIKPSNIMVTDDGLVKILDFGLAKLTALESMAASADNPTVTIATPLTSPGVAMGTVPYMSPEQAVGDAADTRSDVFSIGIVLYEMLGGRRPFAGASNAEIIRAVLSFEPPPLHSLAAGVPDACVRIVSKCLQKNPEDRYRDASELSADLRKVDALAPSTMTMAVARPARSAQRGWFIGIAAVIVVGLLGFYLSIGRKLNSAATPRSTPMSSVESLDRSRAFLQRYDRKGNIDRAIETLETALRQDPTNAALEGVMSEAYFRKYSATSDKTWLKKAVDSGQQAVAANDDLAVAHVAFGVALAADGKGDGANEQFEKARDLDPLNGAAFLGLAKLRAAQPGRLKEAEQLYQKAVDLSPADWRALGEIGIFYYRSARYDDAIAMWKKTLQLAPDNVRQLVNLAGAYQMKDQYAESANLLQRALELDPLAGTWANLSTARFFQGQYSDAVKAMEKAVELAPKNYLYWGNLGDVYRWAPGYKEKAAGAYANAIRLVREKLTANANDIGVRSSLAVYLAKTGDAAGALSEIATIEQSGSNDPGAAFKTALVYELAHNRDKALAALERAKKSGYSKHEIANEPELAALRQDTRYRRILSVAPETK
jgi:eukaryotic-like serine/threonine-protein kinase